MLLHYLLTISLQLWKQHLLQSLPPKVIPGWHFWYLLGLGLTAITAPFFEGCEYKNVLFWLDLSYQHMGQNEGLTFFVDVGGFPSMIGEAASSTAGDISSAAIGYGASIASSIISVEAKWVLTGFFFSIPPLPFFGAGLYKCYADVFYSVGNGQHRHKIPFLRLLAQYSLGGQTSLKPSWLICSTDQNRLSIYLLPWFKMATL